MTNTKKKIVIMCVVMIVTVCTFAFSTLAFFTDSESSKNGTIATGKAAVEIIDITYPLGSNVAVEPGEAIKVMPGYEISKTVTARNVGTLPLYVRVKLDTEIVLAENARGRESEIDLSLVSCNINEEKWELLDDGYYYYRSALTVGSEATPLFTTVKFSEMMGNLYKDGTVNFKVRMEIVQANNNGANAKEAQGWSEPLISYETPEPAATAASEEGGSV